MVSVFIDEDAGGSSPAECFQSQRAGAAEKIEDTGIEDRFAEDGENRLADEVSGRPRDRRGHLDGDAPGFS